MVDYDPQGEKGDPCITTMSEMAGLLLIAVAFLLWVLV